MNKAILKSYIDKIKSININSSIADYLKARQLYEDFKNSLDESWKEKRLKYFGLINSISAKKWDDSVPDDGFFYPLMKAIHYCGIICQINPEHDKSQTNITLQVESKLCNAHYIEKHKKLLDECLNDIENKYCV